MSISLAFANKIVIIYKDNDNKKKNNSILRK